MNRVTEALRWIVPIFEAHDVPFHLTGGLAAHLYGSSRLVNDIDFDVERTALDRVFPLVREYAVSPLERYRDSTWDMYGAALNFNGQAIDLTSATDAFICNKDTGSWDPLESNFGTARWFTYAGVRIPVQSPADLLRYKRKIAYDEAKHLEDVAAIELFLAREAGG